MTRWTLPHDLSSVGTARDLVGAELVGSPLRDDAVLVTSELVANAVDHGEPPVELEIALEGAGLRIVVTSLSADDPQTRVAGDHAPRGRGLAIVSSLATDWGWFRTDGRVTVWAVLTAP